MAGLSFDSKSSNSAFLSAGIFSADSIADLVFSMCSSVIYEWRCWRVCLRGSSLDPRSSDPELRPEFRRIIERIQDKNEAFAETDKGRHRKPEHMIARENV